MTHNSLQDLLEAAGDTVELLRNSPAGPNVYPGVQPEYTNWRDEQQAWQRTCILFDQSFHMADLAVEGPDARALLSGLGVNSFEGFEVDRAKHFVPCSPDGYVIGDVILFALGESRFNLVGRAPALNWITYHAETGGYDVRVELDQRSALRTASSPSAAVSTWKPWVPKAISSSSSTRRSSSTTRMRAAGASGLGVEGAALMPTPAARGRSRAARARIPRDRRACGASA